MEACALCNMASLAYDNSIGCVVCTSCGNTSEEIIEGLDFNSFRAEVGLEIPMAAGISDAEILNFPSADAGPAKKATAEAKAATKPQKKSTAPIPAAPAAAAKVAGAKKPAKASPDTPKSKPAKKEPSKPKAKAAASVVKKCCTELAKRVKERGLVPASAVGTILEKHLKKESSNSEKLEAVLQLAVGKEQVKVFEITQPAEGDGEGGGVRVLISPDVELDEELRKRAAELVAAESSERNRAAEEPLGSLQGHLLAGGKWVLFDAKHQKTL